VGYRTDRVSAEEKNSNMNKHKRSRTTVSSHRNPLFAALAALAFLLAMPAGQIARAQSMERAPMSKEAAAHRHVEGLAMERRGDEQGAFVAFIEAAEDGYPPAQRRLGEIYDSRNAAVVRDYSKSIQWYEKAREGGEEIPPQKSPYPTINIRR
jgi:TPR repeat protein